MSPTTIFWILGAISITVMVAVEAEGDPKAMLFIAATAVALLSVSFLAFLIFAYDGPDAKAPYIRKSLIGISIGVVGVILALLL